MKKILFVAITFFGVNSLVSAQEGAKVALTPAPTKAEAAQADNAKMQTYQAQQKMKMESQKNWIDPNTENYRKAGVPANQITTISASMKNLEIKKAAIQNNTEITEEQKQAALSAVDKEKNAIFQKNMQADTYKKYTQISQQNPQGKSAKTVTPQ